MVESYQNETLKTVQPWRQMVRGRLQDLAWQEIAAENTAVYFMQKTDKDFIFQKRVIGLGVMA